MKVQNMNFLLYEENYSQCSSYINMVNAKNDDVPFEI